MSGEFGRNGHELGLEPSDHAFDRGAHRRNRGDLASAMLGMQRSLELTMARHQRIEHHVLAAPEPQFAAIQMVAAKRPQQPRIDRIGLGLDALNLAERLDPC